MIFVSHYYLYLKNFLQNINILHSLKYTFIADDFSLFQHISSHSIKLVKKWSEKKLSGLLQSHRVENLIHAVLFDAYCLVKKIKIFLQDANLNRSCKKSEENMSFT